MGRIYLLVEMHWWKGLRLLPAQQACLSSNYKPVCRTARATPGLLSITKNIKKGEKCLAGQTLQTQVHFTLKASKFDTSSIDHTLANRLISL